MTRLWLVLSLLAASWPTGAHGQAARVFAVAVGAPADAPEARQVSALARAALLQADGVSAEQGLSVLRGDVAQALLAYYGASQALALGQKAYLALDLAGARAAFEQAMQLWPQALAVLDSPEPVAETLLFLGAACFSARDSACVQAAFARYHVQFGALEPDASVLNPETQLAFARSRQQHQRTARRGQIAIAGAHPLAESMLDGSIVDARAPLEVDAGEHWLRVAVPGTTPFVAVVQVEARATARVQVPPSTPGTQAEALSAALARADDAQAAGVLTRQLGVDALAVVRVAPADGGRLSLSLAAGGEVLTRVAEPGLRARSRAVRALLTMFLERLNTAAEAVPLSAGAPPAPAFAAHASTGADATPSAPRDKPWYRRAWVWTLVGVAVAGGATATALLVRSEGEPQAADQGSSLTLEF